MSPDTLPVAAEEQPRKQSALVRRLILPFIALLNGMCWIAGPGAGKTLGIALTTVCTHLFHHPPLPAIVIDPTGALCAYVLNQVRYVPTPMQPHFLARLKYVDMAATDYIQRMPLYWRRGEETLYAVANRFIQFIERLDPTLKMGAPVEGLNALREVGIYSGMVMAALGLPATDIPHLLHHPKAWLGRLRHALQGCSELQPAVEYFVAYAELTPELQRRRSSSFLNKLIFLADPVMRAMFGTVGAGIDWAEEMRQGRTVLLDFGGETDLERRRFKLVWCFLEILESLKSRGIAGRQQPLLWVIDEISAILGPFSGDRSLLGTDITELITVWARNFGIKVVASLQYPSLCEPVVRDALRQLGTQVIGNVQNPDDALYLARQFHRFDPYLVKKTEPVWMNVEYGSGRLTYSAPTVIDERSVEYRLDEQLALFSDRIRTLPKFHFFLRPAAGEGNLTGQLRHVSLERLDAGVYPDPAIIAEIRHHLRRRDGIALETLLTTLPQKEATTVHPPAGKESNASGILEKGASVSHDHQSNPLPAKKRRKKTRRRGQPTPSPAVENGAWQAQLFSDPSSKETDADAA